MDWISADPWPPREPLREAVSAQYLADETASVTRLLPLAAQPRGVSLAVENRAADWIGRLRRRGQSSFDALLLEYDLSSEEGVLLMGLAEALLRIPDAATAEKLIADKLAGADWTAHLGHSGSLLVNASTWALMLGARMLHSPQQPAALLTRLVERASEPVIRR
ncbi:MAG TPA: bifunctional proline dehydrogenase/L-glutamate gamma-semialdehyde dehydrogenase, partial [Solimonas sp.]|nr:bifunctional proline dehydrogenase/L-glutamate gamma-semialdehyde dehydrogenase [Solimonas sp.]